MIIRRVVIGVEALVALLLLGCCSIIQGAPKDIPVKMTAEEMAWLLQNNFHLEIGKTLFVTTGEYWLLTFSEYLKVYDSLPSLPQCRFKTALVILGKIHETVHPLAAAGIAMGVPNRSPAWFIVIVTADRKVLGWDPITRRVWLLSSEDVELILI